MSDGRPEAAPSAARPDYWPAFVDVLTNLLLVFIFLLSIFALVQFFLRARLRAATRCSTS